MPEFDQVAITSKRSDTTQETHYYIGNSMFRNVYHLGQKQIGTPHEIFQINLPTTENKNYVVIPFSLKKRHNLITVSIFHDWASDLVKLYIIKENEDPKIIYDLISNQKKMNILDNVQDINYIIQSNPLEYYEGIEKQLIGKGSYKLLIMNMDTGSVNSAPKCVSFAMSIYLEEILPKKDSREKTGMDFGMFPQVDDSTEEAVIESISLCQYSFIFPEIFTNLIKLNGGELSIDSIYRFDNDERWKQIELITNANSVIYIKVTDIYNQMSDLDISLIYVEQDKKTFEDKETVIATKKADKNTMSVSEKYAEIQKFVKKGRYLLDFHSSVFDLDTELFPCNRIKLEIEIMPLKDIPDILKSYDT